MDGKILINNKQYLLDKDTTYSYYSDMIQRDAWENDIHLKIESSKIDMLSPDDLLKVDNELRSNNPPFDGLNDLAISLGLSDPFVKYGASYLSIRIGAPADLNLQGCNFSKNKLSLSLLAQQKLDTNKITLAIRGVPDNALKKRLQLSSQIKWNKKANNGARKGALNIELEDTESVLVMLTLGKSTIRRHWVIDSNKARNSRFVAVNKFDKELKMIKKAVIDPTDSTRFENGITALLFLLGFSSSVQLENDSPDIIGMTPGGKLVIVECTIRTADLHAKLGKLVDRKISIEQAMSDSGHTSQVYAYLVCGSSRDQIAMKDEELILSNVILLTKENIEEAFNKVLFPNNPDQLLIESSKILNAKLKPI